ncbi:alpha/beta fold hydrolase [Kordiimonas marina]|uniref:alpha/beta fold hydrolase n=1 Tax=Kordiimonas marina TaxID=2872312 RepID=UPI001FF3E2A3|nr:alpha/beta hydrolase [Kordiimonas marina]MCJ9429043.1 alpha/beta hydrolase [Kordiimonas marina]
MADSAARPTATYTDEYFTNTDGLKQHYRDYNTAGPDAPVVLCIPGLTRNAKDFEEIAAHIADRCRVLCFENRGRGLSEWDPDPSRYTPVTYVGDVLTLVNQLGLKDVIAFGTSLGGLMTMILQATTPGVWRAAIINDIGPEIDDAGIERIKGFVGKGTPPKTWEQAIESTRKIGLSMFPSFTDDEWSRMTHKLYADVDGKPVIQYDAALAQNFDAEPDQAAPDLWPIWAAMYSVPTLVLRGELSDILSAETLDKMAAGHPDLTAVTIPGIGHAPMLWEQESMDAVDNFLARFV